MHDFLLLMHDDVRSPSDPSAWPAYFAMLRGKSAFQGGSEIGPGACFRKSGEAAAATPDVGGYIRVQAADWDAVVGLLAGNPVYEAGGTVEIRELRRT